MIEPDSDKPVPDGQTGELVLTNLGRAGSPLIRYRTGDLVRLRKLTPIAEQQDDGDPGPLARRASEGCAVPRLRVGLTGQLSLLEGGILGRTDDMIHLRGNNVYPAAVEAVIRRFAEVVEFRIVVDQSGALADLRIEIEPTASANGVLVAEMVGRAIRDELLFRVEVRPVLPGTLPRFEMKARRIHKIT